MSSSAIDVTTQPLPEEWESAVKAAYTAILNKDASFELKIGTVAEMRMRGGKVELKLTGDRFNSLPATHSGIRFEINQLFERGILSRADEGSEFGEGSTRRMLRPAAAAPAAAVEAATDAATVVLAATMAAHGEAEETPVMEVGSVVHVRPLLNKPNAGKFNRGCARLREVFSDPTEGRVEIGFDSETLVHFEHKSGGEKTLSISFGQSDAATPISSMGDVQSAINAIERLMRTRLEWVRATVTGVDDETLTTEEGGVMSIEGDSEVLWKGGEGGGEGGGGDEPAAAVEEGSTQISKTFKCQKCGRLCGNMGSLTRHTASCKASAATPATTTPAAATPTATSAAATPAATQTESRPLPSVGDKVKLPDADEASGSIVVEVVAVKKATFDVRTPSGKTQNIHAKNDSWELVQVGAPEAIPAQETVTAAAPAASSSTGPVASGSTAKRKQVAPPPTHWGEMQTAAQEMLAAEVPDESVIRDAVNAAMTAEYPKIDFATVDFEMMAQQRKQFEVDIRAAYKSPLREAFEAVEGKLAALAAVMGVPSQPLPKKPRSG
jgi:hypothetical protein